MADGTLTEVVTEKVADHLEEAAVVTRTLNGKTIGFLLGGLVIGVGIGFYFGRRYKEEKIREEAFEWSEKELDQIREIYRGQLEIIEKTKLPKIEEEEPERVMPPKPELEDVVKQHEIIEETKYSTTTEIDISERPLKPPVPIDPTKKVVRTEDAAKDKDDRWDYKLEVSRRSGTSPFIIHQDEYHTNETGNMQVTYTWYEEDQVLADTVDTKIDNVDELVGLKNLTKFGHGSDDFNVLYVRNPKRELDMEICRSSGSYEQEVEGLEHSDSASFEPMHRHRQRFDEDDERY